MGGGVLGGLAARSERHDRVWEVLDVDHASSMFRSDELYPDALPCLAELRSRGLVVGAAGNTPEVVEAMLRPHVDLVGSSARWGVQKPATEFFERIVDEAGFEAEEIAYVGDRVDNDVNPALAAGMVAVHVRRGPWGHLHKPPPEAIGVRSLAELPEALAHV